MPATLLICDQTNWGGETNQFTIECLTETLSVRELIRARIYQEVQDYNQKTPDYFRGLVQPTDAEQALNGYRLKEKRTINWQEQYERAIDAFSRNGFFILVDDKQAESLDQTFEVKVYTAITFIKLLPLTGG